MREREGLHAAYIILLTVKRSSIILKGQMEQLVCIAKGSKACGFRESERRKGLCIMYSHMIAKLRRFSSRIRKVRRRWH